MDISPETVVVIVTSVITAFGLGKGAEVIIARRAAARKAATEEVEALGFITEGNCRDCRKEIMEGINRLAEVFQEAKEAESASIQELKTSVAVLAGKIGGQAAETETILVREISDHERRFHSARTGTGNYSRDGGR